MRLFYFHIPKTGGQTVAKRLASAFPRERADIMGSDLLYPQGESELRLLLEKNLFVERHVNSHFISRDPFGPVLKNFDGLDMLVTIREPVARIVSSYLHLRREPRNALYRAATILPPQEFFSTFGDLMANRQIKYLVEAFFDLRADPEPLRAQTTKMFDALDRVRWVVPTEAIDEFTMLWQLETRRAVPNSRTTVNVAPRDGFYAEMMALVRGLPSLYSTDLLLWEAAKKRFADYREKVLRTYVPLSAANDAGCAYWGPEGGVWLPQGWHAPQVTPAGTEWWAGPEKYSRILYRRNSGAGRLTFSVIVLCGIAHDDIVALTADRTRVLPMEKKAEKNRWIFSLPLDGLREEGEFCLKVPEVWAPIMTSNDDAETTRKSFATCDWKLW